MFLVAVSDRSRIASASLLSSSVAQSDAQRVMQCSWVCGDFEIDLASVGCDPIVDSSKVATDGSLGLTFGRKLEGGAEGLPASGPWLDLVIENAGEQIYLSRDPTGLKGAYFVRMPWGYLISDHVPALLQCEEVSRTIDIEALAETWFLDFCVAPRTIWADIRAVPAAHTAVLPLRGSAKPRYEQYYVPGRAAVGQPLASAEASETLRRVILDETARSIDVCADKTRVNLLSGGIDSSVVLAACHLLGAPPDYALCFRGEGDADESSLAAATAARLGVRLEVVDSAGSNILMDAEAIVETWAQPYAHGSVHAMQTMLSTIDASAALFTGDGGGEAFVGAPRSLPHGRWFIWPLTAMLHAAPASLQRAMYRRLATRSHHARALAFGLELWSAMTEAHRLLSTNPVTRWETAAVFQGDAAAWLNKASVARTLEALGEKTAYGGEALYARSLPFWWAPEGVYAKTWRLLDARGITGIGPLTAPAFFDTVKRIPAQSRGTRKQALRDAFADVLPKEVCEAPKRGLRPLNRELLKRQADDGIDRLRDTSSTAWNHLFNKDVLTDFWLAHRDGRVYRSNLLYKALIFRAWCDRWQPKLPENSV
jgi:asparagine synthetase B (glutamine-hydrolysing)